MFSYQSMFEVCISIHYYCEVKVHRTINIICMQDVQQMISLSLAKYSADRIGKFDFALENSGGSVILDKCSKTYPLSLATVLLFGFPVWHVATTPKVIIQVSVHYTSFHCASVTIFLHTFHDSHKCILETVGHLKAVQDMPPLRFVMID